MKAIKHVGRLINTDKRVVVVFRYMEQEDIVPDQLIMFTDGYPWESWGNPDYCDTLFIIHGDNSHRIQSPFGVTVHYDKAA